MKAPFRRMSKRQHLVGLLIMLPSIPFALPLSILVFLTRWAHVGAEWLYEIVGTPFLWMNRQWELRCERVNNPE
jgi:hypothetical protein